MEGNTFCGWNASRSYRRALAQLPGKDLTVIEYLDARGPDGKIRKYRVMMIDGRLYPLHAAVSSNWKVHYFSAEMEDFPEHRAEDAAFLADMPGVLGARAMQALAEIQKMLELDYGGVDFGLDENGEILLFEANAMMAVIPPKADARWDYRRPATERIYKAVITMLTERARGRFAIGHGGGNRRLRRCDNWRVAGAPKKQVKDPTLRSEGSGSRRFKNPPIGRLAFPGGPTSPRCKQRTASSKL